MNFGGNKFISRRDNSNPSKTGWKAINKPPKYYTKDRPFVFCTIKRDGICHLLSSRVEFSEQVWSTVIVDNSENAQIFLEEDMLTHKINPVISNGVATIGETNIIPKGIDTVSWY